MTIDSQPAPSASHSADIADIAGVSDVGAVRLHNEDRYLIDRELGLVAVADGMGGHRDGALASATMLGILRAALAREPVPAIPPEPDPDSTTVDARWRHAGMLRDAVHGANTEVYLMNRARGHDEGQGMGTTLTGWRWLPSLSAVVLFHVGDTRLYRYRNGKLVQLTRDQTAYQLALESGAGGVLPPRHVLLQAVGPSATIDPDIALLQVCAGDVLLLCSDGLHGWVPHGELEAALLAEPDTAPRSLDTLCRHLVALAIQHGSRDNITAVAARFAEARG